jgi:hypothetical protein
LVTTGGLRCPVARIYAATGTGQDEQPLVGFDEGLKFITHAGRHLIRSLPRCHIGKA